MGVGLGVLLMLFDDPGTSVVVPSVSYRLGYEPCDVFGRSEAVLSRHTSTSRVIAESNETVMDMFEKMFSEYKSGLQTAFHRGCWDKKWSPLPDLNRGPADFSGCIGFRRKHSTVSRSGQSELSGD